MIRKELNIKKVEWLSDVIKEIPTNTILNKTMTGCGATTLEINAARHSIIIEPNVPVIVGKKAQHSFLFAVYEGTSKEDVKAYLAGEHDGYRKIITTPEGFDIRGVFPLVRRVRKGHTGCGLPRGYLPARRGLFQIQKQGNGFGNAHRSVRPSFCRAGF